MKHDDTGDEALNPLYSRLLQQESGMEDLVLSFLERLPGMFDDILLSYQQSDQDRLASLIHDMKSVGGGYGYPQLTEVSNRIEYALQQGNDDLTGLIEELEIICVRVLRGGSSMDPVKQQA